MIRYRCISTADSYLKAMNEAYKKRLVHLDRSSYMLCLRFLNSRVADLKTEIVYFIVRRRALIITMTKSWGLNKHPT